MTCDSGYKVHAGMCIVSSLSIEARQIETGYEITEHGVVPFSPMLDKLLTGD